MLIGKTQGDLPSMSEEDTSLRSSPQLVSEQYEQVAVALQPKQVQALYKKSQQSNIPFSTLEEVYMRGYNNVLENKEQNGFNRVNSFIAGGEAMFVDNDLIEKRGLWDNIHAKRERIKHGSGERMRVPGSKGAPTAADFKASQRKEEYTGAETVSSDPDNAMSRFVGTDMLTSVYKSDTPGEPGYKSRVTETVLRVVKEAQYHGREVSLNKKMKGDVKKSKVYVKDPSTGNIKKVEFGDPNMKIKKNIPARRKSFRARHHCESPGPKTKARYWSCKAW